MCAKPKYILNLIYIIYYILVLINDTSNLDIYIANYFKEGYAYI